MFGVDEDSLSAMFKRIIKEESFSRKLELNGLFHSYFEMTLAKPGSIDYPFDSLKHVGRILSRDKMVRVITWNIPQAGGLQSYFGFVQVRGRDGQCKLHRLIDARELVVDPMNQRLAPDCWLGALYYDIIDIEHGGIPMYILLGFDFNNILTSKKVIEVVSIDAQGVPSFGYPIFRVDESTLSRIVFEYSARVVMNLKYLHDAKMIVFDHLAPSRNDFTGNFQFYGPDFTYDGFKYNKGYMDYVRNVDMRNPRREKPKSNDAFEKLPEPGFLYKPKAATAKATGK